MGIICYIERMRKIFVAILILALFYFGYNSLNNSKLNKTSDKTIKPSPSPVQEKKPIIYRKSIFVPDWSLNGETIIDNGYDRWIYFGSVNKEKQFVEVLKGKELWYTEKVTSINELESLKINEFEASNFKGAVLDLEISELPTEQLKLQINDGVYKFFKAAKQKNLKVALALYGDLFYRRRPFDLKILNDYCDEIMIMAYDFHKSYGEPGPNFPYEGREIYGYDFKMMTDDYLQFVPSEKITVIFGMFGYDWLVDENKKPIKAAKAVTLNEVNNNFIKKCVWSNCVVKRDSISTENEINYIYSVIRDSFGYMDMHIVWSEDEQSVEMKSEYLKKIGVGSIGYWAYGYF